ncbi:MAG: hypothetical protein D6689_21695 [Deltaproteobacteria bacterium]|nr:MAG: hypothetical protein D6689_21695 [Deltaproteobacteria bacterium]
MSGRARACYRERVRGAVVVALIGAVVFVASPARADGIAQRARQLRASPSFKVRLSAALWLAERRDVRAVRALAEALRHDREATVRALAAAALGRLIDESVAARERDAAIDALAAAARSDADVRVRRKALASYKRVRALRSPDGALPSVFVAIGAPTSRAPGVAAADVQVAVRRALRQAAPDFGQATQRDGWPTERALRRAGTAAFFVNASVRDVAVTRRGGRADVRCTVGMQVNVWRGADAAERLRPGEAASATGTGRVSAAYTPAAIAAARRDCVAAVLDQLAARQVAPFIRRAATTRVARGE